MNLLASSAINSSTAETNRREPVAIVASDFIQTGGMDVANFSLAQFLARRGHPLHLVSHRVDSQLSDLPGVTVHPARRPLNANLLAVPFLDRAGRRVCKSVQAAGGKVIVNGGNCAFPAVNWVHYVHAAYEARVAGSLARRMKNAIAYKVFVRAERKSLKMATLVITNSERTRSDVIEFVGVDPAVIRTVYLGVNPIFQPPTEEQQSAAKEKLGWPADRPIVAFIGAIGDRRKGFDTVFAAWENLCRSSQWDADLVVVGSGAELEMWKQRAVNSGVASSIHFLGFRRDVPQILHASDALVAPTRYEAYGLGVQEALCCGLPAIVSKIAGVAERYPHSLSSLLLDDCNDSTALAKHLMDWRARREELHASVETFGAHLRQRTWDHMAADIEQLILETPNV